MYAVIKTGGKQYKVSKDDVISVEKLSDDAGKKIKLNEVLIISDKGKPIVGDPLIKGASVEAEIMDHSRAAKITVFKKKRRHNYRRKQGHKQNITNLKILSINSSQGKTKTADTEEKKTAAKKAAPKKAAPKKVATKSKKTEDKPKKSDKKAKSEPKKLIKVQRSKKWLTRKQAVHQGTEEIQLEEGLVLKNMEGKMLFLEILLFVKEEQSGSQVKMLA